METINSLFMVLVAEIVSATFKMITHVYRQQGMLQCVRLAPVQFSKAKQLILQKKSLYWGSGYQYQFSSPFDYAHSTNLAEENGPTAAQAITGGRGPTYLLYAPILLSLS